MPSWKRPTAPIPFEVLPCCFRLWQQLENQLLRRLLRPPPSHKLAAEIGLADNKKWAMPPCQCHHSTSECNVMLGHGRRFRFPLDNFRWQQFGATSYWQPPHGLINIEVTCVCICPPNGRIKCFSCMKALKCLQLNWKKPCRHGFCACFNASI